MARILTGIQSSGIPHLGNILGAILPAIEMSKSNKNESLFFIADLHSLTTIKNADKIKHNTYATAAAWLAFGFDTKKNIFYRQSDISEVTELMWILNCFTPYPMLANAHSFKDKSENLSDVNSGLFTYPVLMAADILLYDANIVPVGKDQLQHLEMTRDVASRFNNLMGETFVIPEAKVQDDTNYITGTDGEKMSKSKSNIIDIFLDDNKLRKQIMKIQTQSLSVEEAKNPDQCNVFKLFKLIASDDKVKKLHLRYTKGGIGYGEAKELLYHEILNRFSINREKFFELTNNKDRVEELLLEGAIKARKQAQNVLKRVRSRVGY